MKPRYTKTQIALANRAIGRITQCGFSPDTLTDNDLLEFQGVGPKTIPLIRELCSAKAAEPKPTTVTIPVSLGRELAELTDKFIQLMQDKIVMERSKDPLRFDDDVLVRGLQAELAAARQIRRGLFVEGSV